MARTKKRNTKKNGGTKKMRIQEGGTPSATQEGAENLPLNTTTNINTGINPRNPADLVGSPSFTPLSSSDRGFAKGQGGNFLEQGIEIKKNLEIAGVGGLIGTASGLALASAVYTAGGVASVDQVYGLIGIINTIGAAIESGGAPGFIIFLDPTVSGVVGGIALGILAAYGTYKIKKKNILQKNVRQYIELDIMNMIKEYNTKDTAAIETYFGSRIDSQNIVSFFKKYGLLDELTDMFITFDSNIFNYIPYDKLMRPIDVTKSISIIDSERKNRDDKLLLGNKFAIVFDTITNNHIYLTCDQLQDKDTRYYLRIKVDHTQTKKLQSFLNKCEAIQTQSKSDLGGDVEQIDNEKNRLSSMYNIKDFKKTGYRHLGVTLKTTNFGLLVTNVEDDDLFKHKKVQKNDIIVLIDGKSMRNVDHKKGLTMLDNDDNHNLVIMRLGEIPKLENADIFPGGKLNINISTSGDGPIVNVTNTQGLYYEGKQTRGIRNGDIIVLIDDIDQNANSTDEILVTLEEFNWTNLYYVSKDTLKEYKEITKRSKGGTYDADKEFFPNLLLKHVLDGDVIQFLSISKSTGLKDFASHKKLGNIFDNVRWVINRTTSHLDLKDKPFYIIFMIEAINVLFKNEGHIRDAIDTGIESINNLYLETTDSKGVPIVDEAGADEAGADERLKEEEDKAREEAARVAGAPVSGGFKQEDKTQPVLNGGSNQYNQLIVQEGGFPFSKKMRTRSNTSFSYKNDVIRDKKNMWGQSLSKRDYNENDRMALIGSLIFSTYALYHKFKEDLKINENNLHKFFNYYVKKLFDKFERNLNTIANYSNIYIDIAKAIPIVIKIKLGDSINLDSNKNNLKLNTEPSPNEQRNTNNRTNFNKTMDIYKEFKQNDIGSNDSYFNLINRKLADFAIRTYTSIIDLEDIMKQSNVDKRLYKLSSRLDFRYNQEVLKIDAPRLEMIENFELVKILNHIFGFSAVSYRNKIKTLDNIIDDFGNDGDFATLKEKLDTEGINIDIAAGCLKFNPDMQNVIFDNKDKRSENINKQINDLTEKLEKLRNEQAGLTKEETGEGGE